MNKKWLTGLSIVLGGVMLCGAALVNAGTSTGYEVYKTALKNTKTVSSVTGTVGVSLQDNGTRLFKVDEALKLNQESRAMSGVFSVTAGDQANTLNVYRQDGQFIVKNSDQAEYLVSAANPNPEFGDRQERQRPADDPVLAQEVENMVDLLVGSNIQESFGLQNNPDGTKEISLQLNGDQISPIQNAATSLIYKMGTRAEHPASNSLLPAADEAVASLPELVSNIHVASLELKATVNAQDRLVAQNLDVVITGEDASGSAHNLAASVDLNLSDINQTTPDTVDLTGKTVTTMSAKEFRHRGF